MAENQTKDLTVGSPMRLVLSFMLPLTFGLLFQQFYSMVDTVVVGKFLGVDALAGVGSTGSVNFLVLGLCNGICAGFAIPVAQKFGQRDYEGLRRFVGNMIWLGTVIALVVTLATTVLCRQILSWMDTPEDTFAYAYDYIFLIFLGIPATMLYNLLSGIIRSLGDSKTPLFFLILSSLLNVGLDVLFIVTFRMGVAGAGWATLLSQLISGLLCLAYMARKFPILRLSREDIRFRAAFARRLLTMGLPMGLQYSITAIGSILLQTAVNGLGSTAMAAVTAGSKMNLLCACPFDAMGTTAATYAGQNLGAGKPERIHQGVLDCTLLGVVYSVLIYFAMYFGGRNLSMLFLDAKNQAAADVIVPLSQQFLLTCIAFYVPLLFVNLLRFTIQGLGFSELAVIAGVFEMVARGVFGLCLVPWLGFSAVCYASPAAWIMADLFLFPAYFHCMKKRGYKPEPVAILHPFRVKS
ncbi:MAG: MATE family efflux transporter [Eubacteriales bacterium]|nr:MATE family efflux transporter [Eubacteriales bacterium]